MLPLEHTQTQAAICSTYTYYVGPVRFLNKIIMISLKKLHSYIAVFIKSLLKRNILELNCSFPQIQQWLVEIHWHVESARRIFDSRSSPSSSSTRPWTLAGSFRVDIFAQKSSVLFSGERRRQGKVAIRRRRRRRKVMSRARKIEVTPLLDHQAFLDRGRLTKKFEYFFLF